MKLYWIKIKIYWIRTSLWITVHRRTPSRFLLNYPLDKNGIKHVYSTCRKEQIPKENKVNNLSNCVNVKDSSIFSVFYRHLQERQTCIHTHMCISFRKPLLNFEDCSLQIVIYTVFDAIIILSFLVVLRIKEGMIFINTITKFYVLIFSYA